MQDGNPQTEDGHTDIANETVEALARYRLSGQEYQVLWVIWRKTYGWHKKKDKISLGQIAELTGMNRPGVARIINKLVSKSVIKKDNSYINVYEFNKHYKEWRGVIKKDNSEKCYQNREQGVIKKDNKTVIRKDTHKRKERKSLQKKTTAGKKSASGKVKNLTSLQKIIEAYKKIKGFDKVPNWDKVNFSRFTRDANKLLLLAENDIDMVIAGIIAIGNRLESKDLDWNLSTIVRFFPEYLVEKKEER